jgi:hypothetical protein
VNPKYVQKTRVKFCALKNTRAVDEDQMAGITLSQAEAKLAEYLAAETAILLGQSYSMNGKSLSRADLEAVQQGIEIWDARVKRLSRGGISVRGVTIV